MLMRSDKMLAKIELALRLPPDPEAELDERIRGICNEIIRIREKAGELDAADLRALGIVEHVDPSSPSAPYPAL